MAAIGGFAGGILASEEGMRKNITAGVEAGKTLAEIGKLEEEIKGAPGQRALTKAQAVNTRALGRLHGAQAETAESVLAGQRELDAAWKLHQVEQQDVERQRAQFIAQKQARGEVVTAADFDPVTRKPKSLAANARSFLEFAERRLSPDKLLPLAKKVADIEKDEAQRISAEWEGRKRQLDSQAAEADRLGSLVAYAMKGPAEYAQARLQAAQEGLPVGHLPNDFKTAWPKLQILKETALGAKTRAELAIRQQSANADSARAAAAQAQAGASVRRADAYVAESTARRDLIVKYGGEKAEAAIDASRSVAAGKQIRTLAEQIRVAPRIPARETLGQAHVGKYFTGADNKIYRYDGRDASGRPLFAESTVRNAAMADPSFREATRAGGDSAEGDW